MTASGANQPVSSASRMTERGADNWRRIEVPVSGQNLGVQIMSVTGPVQPRDLGIVLPHEPVFADLVREYRGPGLLNDGYLACRELEAFAAASGTTLVDLTVDEIGRNPPALRRVAEAVGADNRVIAADLVSCAGGWAVRFGIWLREDLMIGHCQWSCCYEWSI
jgi:hypothetical protein